MGSVSKSHLFSANFWWEDGKHFFEVFLYTFTSHKYNSCSFRCLLNKGCICLMNWIDKLRQNLYLCGGFVVLVEGHLEIALGRFLLCPCSALEDWSLGSHCWAWAGLKAPVWPGGSLVFLSHLLLFLSLLGSQAFADVGLVWCNEGQLPHFREKSWVCLRPVLVLHVSWGTFTSGSVWLGGICSPRVFWDL